MSPNQKKHGEMSCSAQLSEQSRDRNTPMNWVRWVYHALDVGALGDMTHSLLMLLWPLAWKLWAHRISITSLQLF
jgi:hypothetical protein